MSLYDYSCEKHGVFEVEHSVHIKLEFCPKCAEEGNAEHPVTRLISLTGRGVVLLEGQDLVDKVKADAKQLQRDAGNSEKTYSNLVGEGMYQNLQKNIDKNRR